MNIITSAIKPYTYWIAGIGLGCAAAAVLWHLFSQKRPVVTPAPQASLSKTIADRRIEKIMGKDPLTKSLSQLESNPAAGSDPTEEAFQRGVLLKEAVEVLEQEKNPQWQEFAIKMIRQNRYDSFDLEEARLKGFGILTPEVKNRIDSTTRKKEVKIILAQALEIRRIFKDTHYVFIHGQHQVFYPISAILKEKVKKNGAETTQFKYVRSLQHENTNGLITKYINAPDVWDHGLETRKELIAVSADIFDSAPGESAVYFLNNNYSIKTRDDREKLILSVTEITGLPHSNATQIAGKSWNLSDPGNLLVFCIPKEKYNAIGYKAHPYGCVCKCHADNERALFLERYQRGDSGFVDPCQSKNTQYRIFWPAFRREDGCRLYYLTPHSIDTRTQIKQNAKDAMIRSNL